MQNLLLLACPVGMGVMMWMMSRGMRKNSGGGTDSAPTSRTVDALRDEHRRLGDELARLENDRADDPALARLG